MAMAMSMVMPTRARETRASETRVAYDDDTTRTLDAMERGVREKTYDRDRDREYVLGWFERNKKTYDQKTRKQSFLLTTRLIAMWRSREDVDEEKFLTLVDVARKMTDGSMTNAEASEAYGDAVWGNYDKSDVKNRIGLCAFGATAPTKYLGIDCDGY